MTSGGGVNGILLRLIGVQVCTNGCMAGIRMAAPLLALRDGYSAAAVGMLLALFAFIQLFLAIPAGRYADRTDLKRPVGFCTVAAVSGALLVAAWPTFGGLCVAALLTGGANGAAVITLQRHAGRLADDPIQIRQVFGWLAVAPSIANFVGPFLAGLVIDFAGFRASFVTMAVLAFFSWMLVRSSGDAPATPTAPAPESADRSWDLLADPRMRLLLLLNWILTSCWDVHTFVLPILGHERGLSASAIGGILGAFAIAATVVRLFIPMIAEHVQEWAAIAGAMVAAALLYAVYPLLPSAPSMFVCSVLLGLSLGSVQPMIMSALHLITPAHRQGEALGLRLISINVSSILMPMVFGTVGASIGVASVFWAVSAGVLSCLRGAWKLRDWSHDE